MDREYIKIGKAKSIPLDLNYVQLKTLDDSFWLENAFYYLLEFYKNHDKAELKNKYEKSNTKERLIAKYIRRYLNNQPTFNYLFKAVGENTNDEEIEGNYDITIISTLWSSNFHLECKNLSAKQDSINKYVYYKRNSSKPDGGIYRYFNGKYAQSQSFGGMLGFVLEGETTAIKTRIIDKIKNTPFDNIPEGDLIRVEQNSIAGNDFTFNTIHNRNNKEFLVYHLLFDLQ